MHANFPTRLIFQVELADPDLHRIGFGGDRRAHRWPFDCLGEAARRFLYPLAENDRRAGHFLFPRGGRRQDRPERPGKGRGEDHDLLPVDHRDRRDLYPNFWESICAITSLTVLSFLSSINTVSPLLINLKGQASFSGLLVLDNLHLLYPTLGHSVHIDHL